MSNFCPDTSGWRWSLVQVRLLSRSVGREGHCRQMSLACVGSTRIVPATLGLPPLTGVCFPCLHCSGSRLLSREQALSCVHFPGPSSLRFRFLDTPHSVGPAFCAFPVPSSSGNQELDKRTLPRCSTTSLPIPASVSRCAGPVHHVSLLGS